MGSGGLRPPYVAPSRPCRLGVHIDSVQGDHWARLTAAHVQFVLVNENPRFAYEYAAAEPTAHVVVRNYTLEEVLFSGDPVAAARRWDEAHMARFAVAEGYPPSVRERCYWQGVNEPPVDTPERRRWLTAFELERMRLLEERGLKAALFAFAVGTSPIGALAVEDYRAAFERARAGGHLVAFHEYFANRADDLMVSNWGYLCRRYNRTLALLGLTARDVRAGITECGADYIAQIPQSGPYRGRIAGDRYVAELARLDRWWREDGVLGGAVFVDGCWNREQWRLYDLAQDAPTRELLYNYICSENGG